MKEKWNERTNNEKLLIIVRIVASIGVVIFSMLQLLGVWEKAINVSAPLVGVVLLVQSIQEWKKSRGVAVFGLLCALFIFICTIVVLFF